MFDVRIKLELSWAPRCTREGAKYERIRILEDYNTRREPVLEGGSLITGIQMSTAGHRLAEWSDPPVTIVRYPDAFGQPRNPSLSHPIFPVILRQFRQ